MNLYQKDLEKAIIINKNLNVKAVNQDDVGMLNISKIFEVCPPLASFIISGPHEMIKGFRNILISQGIPANNALTDDWK